MRINVSPFRFAVCVLGALFLFGAPAFSQQRLERDSSSDHAKVQPQHAVHDWTHSHMLFPRVGPTAKLTAVQNDPRAIQHWQEGYREDYRKWQEGKGEGEGDRDGDGEHEGEGSHRHHKKNAAFHRDWAIPIGGVVDDAMYPAKWTFDSNETVTATSCTGSLPGTNPDYLVAGVDASTTTGGAAVGQPDIVGLNNLYSGTAPGPTGFCNRAVTSSDDGTDSTVLFSYAIVADGGNVTTSPTVSLDGNLIAFVERGNSNAHFHVLAWKAGDGVNASAAQDALGGVLATITSFSGSAPGAQSGLVTDLALTGGTDTFSSPIVDYTNDVAYVGDDFGNIYRILHVFCPSFNPCGGLAPSLDPTWGNAGVLSIDGVLTGGAGTDCGAFTSSNVTGIVVDPLTGNVFAGCSDGNLYGFDSTGAPLVQHTPAVLPSAALSAAAAASGGTTVYTGTFSSAISVGATVWVTGFTNAANNGTFTVQAATTTQLTLNNRAGVAETTTAAVEVLDFQLSAAGTTDGTNTVYTGTFSPTITVGATVSVTGFTNTANNGTFTVVASTSTQLTLSNPIGAAETNAAVVTPPITSPLAVGDGSPINFGGLTDPPVLDVVNGWVYEETDSCITGLSGCPAPPGGPGFPVLVQTDMYLDPASLSVATLFNAAATGNATVNLHAPAFNNAYFNGGGTPLIYEYSSDVLPGPSSETVLYGIAVGSGNAMTSGTPTNALDIGGLGGAFEISPVTEFFTPSVPEDRIFASPINQAPASPTVVAFDVNTFPATANPESFASEGTGTSGIIVDNTSAGVGQANSIYFGTLGTGGADSNAIVKLTQLGLF